jgi:hypothetical protein
MLQNLSPIYALFAAATLLAWAILSVLFFAAGLVLLMLNAGFTGRNRQRLGVVRSNVGGVLHDRRW